MRHSCRLSVPLMPRVRLTLFGLLVSFSCLASADTAEVCSSRASIYSNKQTNLLTLSAPLEQHPLVAFDVGQYRLLASRTSALEYISEVLRNQRHENFRKMFVSIREAQEDDPLDLGDFGEPHLSLYLMIELLAAERGSVLDLENDTYLTSLSLEEYDCRHPEGHASHGGRLGKTQDDVVVFWNHEWIY